MFTCRNRRFSADDSDMQHQGAANMGEGFSGGLSRREVVAGGGLLLGTLFLAACTPGRQSASLPGPYWSDPGSSAPISNDIRSAPVSAPVAAPPSVPADFSTPPGVIPRSAWAGMSTRRPPNIFDMNGIYKITVHHDGMPPAMLSSSNQVASRIEQIRDAHVEGRGWADIAYHYVIDPSGRIWEGRNIRYQGAHVKNQNENNLGILVMGNFQVQTPTSSAVASLDRFLVNQMQRYNIGIGAVRTHQERAPTECPGRSLQAYMNRTRGSGGTLYAMAGRVGLARG